jgi:hypothetical protein
MNMVLYWKSSKCSVIERAENGADANVAMSTGTSNNVVKAAVLKKKDSNSNYSSDTESF